MVTTSIPLRVSFFGGGVFCLVPGMRRFHVVHNDRQILLSHVSILWWYLGRSIVLARLEGKRKSEDAILKERLQAPS